MHPLNIFFDKVFVISIKRNQQRLDLFIKNNPDLDMEIFQGIDGTLLETGIKNVCDFPSSFFTDNNLMFEKCQVWNKGQLGCAMSNLLVQKEILKRKLQKVLVLEDDALLLGNQISYFKEAIKELPENWDLFYLGFNAISKWSEHPLKRVFLRIKYLVKPTSTNGMESNNRHKRFLSSSFSKHLNLPGIYTGTHAYALSYEGAKKIVALDTPLQHGFDTTLMYANYNGLVNGFSLRKPLFIPNSRFSTSLVN